MLTMSLKTLNKTESYGFNYLDSKGRSSMNGTFKHKLTVLSGVLLLFFIALSCQSQKQSINSAPAETNQGQMAPVDIAAKFTASGYMGDGEQGNKYIQLLEASKDNPHSAPFCIRIKYSPGPNGWGGIYWQNRPDNWGDQPGENWSKAGYGKISFWARGETGNEIVEFKAGGINAPGKKYRDSFEITSGKLQLSKEWKEYTLELRGQDLTSVIGGFCWVAAKSANPNGATFYLDDIRYEP